MILYADGESSPETWPVIAPYAPKGGATKSTLGAHIPVTAANRTANAMQLSLLFLLRKKLNRSVDSLSISCALGGNCSLAMTLKNSLGNILSIFIGDSASFIVGK